MKTSTILFIAILLPACGVVRPVLDQDNTKVEVHTVEVPVHDTAYVQLPVYVEKVATLDTVSVLENTFARSSAVVTTGVLHHSLETLPVTLPIPVDSKIVYRDSVVFRDRLQTMTVEVEKPLTRWQKAKQKVGGICLLLIILYGLYLIIHFIYNLKSFKL